MNVPDRTQGDRRTSNGSVWIEKRQSERRISPAIGEHAIQECARLREVNARLLAALRWMSEEKHWNTDECVIKRTENAGETHGIFMYSWGLRPWRFAADALGNLRFPNVSCSQCGAEFGPGAHGFSSCESHAGITKATKP